MKKSFLICFIFLFIVDAISVLAYTSITTSETCPLCGEEFSAEHAMSGTVFGRRTDLKPFGATVAPWPIPVCPNCHFVLYSDSLSEEEIRDLREFVNSELYRSEANDMPSHFLLARIYEHKKMDRDEIAFKFLQASWQSEGDANKYFKCLWEVEKNLYYYLNTEIKDDDDWVNSQLIYGEVLRLQGEFERAFKHYLNIRDDKRLQDEYLQNLIEYELELIEAGDSIPHEMPK